MIPHASGIYEGVVVHKRLAPRRHAFAYRVFALCLDVDEIDRLDRSLRLFSRGRCNLVGFYDADVGEPGAAPVADKIRRLLDQTGLARFGERISLVCYPRILGYVFNPLSVYFCRDAAGAIGAVVYEVTNTFGERTSYVIPVEDNADAIAQTCTKQMYVSPFTAADGDYGFHCLAPAETVVIGVNFRQAGQPILKTHFRGVHRPLDDATIARLMLRYPLMTVKVVAAIHFEAARLWTKGVPMVARHTSPRYSATLVERSLRNPNHA